MHDTLSNHHLISRIIVDWNRQKWNKLRQ